MIHVLGAAVLGWAVGSIVQAQHRRGRALATPLRPPGMGVGRLYRHPGLFVRHYSGWGNRVVEPPEPWAPNGPGSPYPRWVFRRGLWEDPRGTP